MKKSSRRRLPPLHLLRFQQSRGTNSMAGFPESTWSGPLSAVLQSSFFHATCCTSNAASSTKRFFTFQLSLQQQATRSGQIAMKTETIEYAHHSGVVTASSVPKFLRSLYDMLQYEDQTILAWSPDGSFFQVFDTRRLEQEVLARYFKHSKFTSLQRQLNNFGFRKWTKTRSNVCTFSHDVLHRCHPSKLASMVELAEEATAARANQLLGTRLKALGSHLVSRVSPQQCSKRRRIEPQPEPDIVHMDHRESLLEGLNEIDVCALDWSLVTDRNREDDLLTLIEPLMEEPFEFDEFPSPSNPHEQLRAPSEQPESEKQCVAVNEHLRRVEDRRVSVQEQLF